MRKINWTFSAKIAYHNQLIFWKEHNQSESYPLKIIKEVNAIETILMNNPFVGKMVIEDPSYRQILVLKCFWIYYTVTEDTINIVAFKSTYQL
jgi:hypothetical protein